MISQSLLILFVPAADPTYSAVTYAAGTSSLPDNTGTGVTVATVTFTDTDAAIEEALTLTMATNQYFTFTDNLDGTGKLYPFEDVFSSRIPFALGCEYRCALFRMAVYHAVAPFYVARNC